MPFIATRHVPCVTTRQLYFTIVIRRQLFPFRLNANVCQRGAIHCSFFSFKWSFWCRMYITRKEAGFCFARRRNQDKNIQLLSVGSKAFTNPRGDDLQRNSPIFVSLGQNTSLNNHVRLQLRFRVTIKSFCPSAYHANKQISSQVSGHSPTHVNLTKGDLRNRVGLITSIRRERIGFRDIRRHPCTQRIHCIRRSDSKNSVVTLICTFNRSSSTCIHFSLSR